MTLQERLDTLKQQRDLIKEQFIKVSGAIEMIESMIADEKNNDKKEKPKKKD